ncbi:flavin monoamine oxidase family protein [Streptomyces sp. NPDC001970]
MSSRTSSERSTAPRTIGRRSLLKATAATTAASAIGVATAGTSRAADDVMTDVVVVGAGYAGGTAARELSAKGLNVVVLEARNRIGGRIWTDTFAGQQIDLGGSWVSPDHTLVTKEFQRYGITTVPELANTSSVMPAANGFQTLTPAEAGARMDGLLTKFFAGAEQYFPRPHDPLYRKDLLKNVDPLSFRDRIAQLGLDDLDTKWLAGYTAGYVGGDNSRGALTALAQWWALGNWSLEGWHNQMGFKPTTGMTALLQKMLAGSTANVRLGTPVTAITEQYNRVRVKAASGQVFNASAVVVAVPVNVWKTITFNPGLPSVHATATQEGVGVPLGTKLWIQLGGQVDAVYGQGTETSPLPMLIPERRLPGGGRLMIGFAGPSLDVASKTAVQNAVRQYIPGATVVAYRYQEWHKDQWSRGGWGLRRPGQMLKQLPAIQQPHGRMVFAGADIATGWSGSFIEGAVESGFRAADQAAALAQ